MKIKVYRKWDFNSVAELAKTVPLCGAVQKGMQGRLQMGATRLG